MNYSFKMKLKAMKMEVNLKAIPWQHAVEVSRLTRNLLSERDL